MLILGISEETDENRIYPGQITWGAPSITKETIENIIKDNTDPPLKALILPIRKSKEEPEVIFLIDIPKSNDLHMVYHRFFKRLNFQSPPMNQRDVVNFIRERLSYERCAWFRLHLDSFLFQFTDEMLYRLLPNIYPRSLRDQNKIIDFIESFITNWEDYIDNILKNTPINNIMYFGLHVATYKIMLNDIDGYPHEEITPEEKILFDDIKKEIFDLDLRDEIIQFLKWEEEALGLKLGSIDISDSPSVAGIKARDQDNILRILGAKLSSLKYLSENILKLMKKLNELKTKYGDFDKTRSIEYINADI